MKNSIVFVGGIHGVGKSTICKELASTYGLDYLSASEVLQWEKLNDDHTNKKVNDISETQKRLINGLQRIVNKNKTYILDGHYCLFDKLGQIQPIPVEVFSQIAPISLILILGDIADIKGRIEARDNVNYSYAQLETMQEREHDHANFLSHKLNIPLVIVKATDYTILKQTISQITAAR